MELIIEVIKVTPKACSASVRHEHDVYDIGR